MPPAPVSHAKFPGKKAHKSGRNERLIICVNLRTKKPKNLQFLFTLAKLQLLHKGEKICLVQRPPIFLNFYLFSNFQLGPLFSLPFHIMSNMTSNASNLSKNSGTNASRSPRSVKSSRPNSADSRSSWLSVKMTNKTFKNHSIDKTLKKIDATFEKDSAFIQQLEKKPQEQDIRRRQAAELLNKRWNDEVYIPTQTSIHKAMDANSDAYSNKLQEQYAHYLNHNNLSDGAVYLDVFDENSSNSNDYQPLKLKRIQADILTPEPVALLDPLKKQFQSNHAMKIMQHKHKSKYSMDKNNINFWTTLVKGSTHIESPERQMSRMRVKISDANRQSTISWG